MLPYATDIRPARTYGHATDRVRLRPPGPAAAAQLVTRVVADQRLTGVDALPVQLRECRLHIAPDHAHRDPENALPTLEQVDDLVRR